MKVYFFIFANLLSLLGTAVATVKHVEYEPMEKRITVEYEKRGHVWPPERYLPNTPGWQALMQRRFAQIQQIEDLHIKNIGWIETLRAGITFPNFTEYGWGLTSVAQDDLMDELTKGIEQGLATAEPEWSSNPNSVLLIHRPDLLKRAVDELKSILEAWTGIKLVSTDAKGFRAHRNNATSFMHSENANTRPLVGILQIASGPITDASPWPVAVEDYEGNTNLVYLTPGDVVMLESSKLLHGRPLPFAGNWTCAIEAFFVPHDPVFEFTDHEMEANFALPTIWRDVPEREDDFQELEFVGMSWTEPSCPDKWCALLNAIPWHGPAERGYVVTTGKTRGVLEAPHDEL